MKAETADYLAKARHACREKSLCPWHCARITNGSEVDATAQFLVVEAAVEEDRELVQVSGKPRGGLRQMDKAVLDPPSSAGTAVCACIRITLSACGW